MITQSKSYEQLVFNGWRSLKWSTFFWSSSSGAVQMSSSGPGEQRRFLGWRGWISVWLDTGPIHWWSISTPWGTRPPEGMAGSITWSSLWNLMHIILCVTCQCRHSRNVLTKALRNIHCHCSTGFMKSGVLHLRHSLKKTIYPYKDLEKPKQKSR